MSSDLPGSTQTAVEIAPAQDEADESPLASLRRRLISAKDMTHPQRIITAIGAGALLLMAILLITDALPQPTIAAGISDAGADVFVPVVTFIAALLTLVGALALAVAGALTSPWYIRLPISFGLALTLGVGAIINITTAIGLPDAGALPFVIAFLAHIGQIVTLLILCVVAVRGRDHAQIQGDPRTSWPAKAVRTALTLVGAYYGLGLVSWLIMVPFTHQPAFKLFTDDVASQLAILPVLLTVIVYWAAAGQIEWGDLAATGLSFVADKAPRGLWVANTLVALAALGFAAYQGAILHWPALIGALALCLVSAASAAFARPRASWPEDVPVVAVVVGAALLFFILQFVTTLTVISFQIAGFSADRSQNALPPIQTALGGCVIALGLSLVARGRRPDRMRTSVVGVFLAIAGGLVALISFPQALVSSGVTQKATPFVTIYSLLVVAALLALGVTVYFARNPATRQATTWLRASLALTIGLATIALLVKVVIPALDALGALSGALTALLFLASAAWDLATSGADVTNGGSKRFSRSTRLLLYLAYAMIAALTFTYTAAQRLANGHTPAQYLSDADLLLPGLYALGVAAILLTFILRVGRAWGRRAEPGAEMGADGQQ